jgi:hypothetical protein
VPARSGASKLVVTNLRDQPVEIHHGDEVVVVPPLERVELPVVRAGGDHLAELARQGLVSVESKPTPGAAASPRRRAATARAGSKSTKRRRSGTSTNPPKKPPEGGS